MKKALAVLLSDVHSALGTLELARASLSGAIKEAARLGVRLIIPGDLNDTKAIIRGEVAIMLIDMMKYAAKLGVKVTILVGNHDRLNEKAAAHALEFLRPYAEIIDHPVYDQALGVWLVPYFSDSDKLKEFIHYEVASQSDPQTLIMHQGLKGAHMGDYVVDRTSIEPEFFDGLRVISGHYHRAQDIKCGKTGLWTYIGTPYTVTFTEATDGPKGFRVLHADGSLTSVPLGLRKHVIVERTVDTIMDPIPGLSPKDRLWIKVTGPYSELEKLDKKTIGMAHLGHQDYRLDKDQTDEMECSLQVEEMMDDEMLDRLISDSEETAEQKTYLSALWREILA